MKNLVIVVLIALIAVVLGVMIFNQAGEEQVDYSIDSSREVALEYVENDAPTYVFDGSGLELVDESEVEEGVFEFVFDFDSSAAGYGDREDQMLAQVITSHTIVVTVKDGEVISAITDGVYSEVDEKMMEDMDSEGGDNETVSVYFVTVVDGQEGLVAVEREVALEEGVSVELATLEALLSGLNVAETDMGYSSAISEDVEVLGFSISEGVAYADFSNELDENVAGSAMVTTIRGQIEETLKQFDSIDEVVISVEGNTEEVLQP